jgi:hypothetical protein
MTLNFILNLITFACLAFAFFSLGRCVEIMKSIRETNDETIASLRNGRG